MSCRDGRLTIIRLITLDETPPIDVDDHTSAPALASKQIETTNSLTESLDDIFSV